VAVYFFHLLQLQEKNMRPRKLIDTLPLAFLLAAGSIAHAELIAYESFSGYSADADLAGQTTSSSDGFVANTDAWVGSSTVRQFRSSSTGLSYGSLVSSGGSAFSANPGAGIVKTESTTLTTSVGSPFVTSGQIAFVSALVNIDDAVERGYLDVYWATNLREFGFRIDSSGGIDFGRFSGDSLDVFFDTGESLASGTNLLVMSVDSSGSGHNYSFWLNPTNLGGAAPTATYTDTGGFGINNNWVHEGIGLRADFQLPTGDHGPEYVDEIRAGTTWESVTPIPEPGALALAGIALACLVVFRRRR
jgi:hypothetical protein